MKRSIRAVYHSTIAFGAVATIVAVWLTTRHGTPPWWVLAGVVASATLGELATINGDQEEGDQAFSFATTAHLTGAMLLMPGWAALAAGLGSAAGELGRRARPMHVALNASLATFCTLAGSLVFHAVHLDGSVSAHAYPAVLAMLAVFIPLNLTPPGVVVTLMSNQTLRPLAWIPPADLVTFAMEACVAALIALIVETSPSFLLFLCPLLVAVFLALKRARLLSLETRNTLRALVTIIEAKDPMTAAHSERVGDLATRVGEALGLATTQVRQLRWAARLHDIGKVAVDDAILQSPDGLSNVDWEVMRRHPAVAAELLDHLSLTRAITPAIRYHHERHDGEGYYLVRAEDIPLEASIIAIADAFDSMTSRRTYRPALSFDDALGRLEAGAGTQFHPELVAAFTAMMRGREVVPLARRGTGISEALRYRLRRLRRARPPRTTRPVGPAPPAPRSEPRNGERPEVDVPVAPLVAELEGRGR